MIISMIANPVYILRMGLIPTEVQQGLVPDSTMGYAHCTERSLLFISSLYWSHILSTRIWVPTVGVSASISTDVTCL